MLRETKHLFISENVIIPDDFLSCAMAILRSGVEIKIIKFNSLLLAERMNCLYNINQDKKWVLKK